MPTITGFNVTINSMCEPAQKKCFLAYTYNVVWDEDDPQEAGDFNVKSYLWGGTSFDHSAILTNNDDDLHVVNRKTPMPVTRKIPIECERLDQYWGDSIIMKLVMSPDGQNQVRYEAIASTEMEQELATAFFGPEEQTKAA